MKMIKPRLFLFALLFSITSSTFAYDWLADRLGQNYVCTTIQLKPEKKDSPRATIIKKDTPRQSDTAVLYLHGFNDYFFQSALGDSVIAHKMAFYAIDLRRYGRSYREGEQFFETRRLDEYFEELEAALKLIKAEGYHRIICMGHSTGGLIFSYFLSKNEARYPEIKGLILNSPFLDMNLSGFQEKVLLPVVTALPFKNIRISQGKNSAYAESLLKEYHGEWEYDTSLKKEISPKVSIGWLAAIRHGQRWVHRKAHIQMPILLMHSDKSAWPKEWTPLCNEADIVLDVNDISRYGKRLGPNIKEVVIPRGIHDLILSQPSARNLAYQSMFEWMEMLVGK